MNELSPTPTEKVPPPQEGQRPYEPPAIIYETTITTRAGSPLAPNFDPARDPGFFDN